MSDVWRLPSFWITLLAVAVLVGCLRAIKTALKRYAKRGVSRDGEKAT